MAVRKLVDDSSNDPTSTGSDLEDMRPVILPSGIVHNIHKSEVDTFNDLMDRYQKDNGFTNASDLSDLSQVLVMEQLLIRWSNWISTGRNYRGDRINEKELQDQIKNMSASVRAIKKSLTIDKESRDKQKANDDIAEYIEKLRIRAKYFGIKRNTEFAKGMEIFQELRAKIGLYERCDERDRVEQKANLEDIYKWLVEEAFPLYEEIDRKFRNETPEGVDPHSKEGRAVAGGQRAWVQEM